MLCYSSSLLKPITKTRGALIILVSMGWAIALHGGAGDIPRDLPPELRQLRESCLRRCLDIAIDALNSHKSPLDVVELVVCILLSSFV